MLPLDKIHNLIKKHNELEEKLASGDIDKKKYAQTSKEYSDLNEIIKTMVKKGDKNLLLSILDSNNRRRYLGVKIN